MTARASGTNARGKHPGGRPSKITRKLIEEIALAVERGNYFETACAMYGISRVTKLAWLRRGRSAIEAAEKAGAEDKEKGKIEPQEKLYVEFLYAIEIAQARAEAHDLGIVTGAAVGGMDQGEVVETRKEVPVLAPDGKAVLGPDGMPLRTTEVTTTRKLSKTLPTWQAAAWKLERRDPARFGRRVVDVNNKHQNPDGSPLAGREKRVRLYLPHNGREASAVVDSAPPAPPVAPPTAAEPTP
jgi:hypothetical protein